MGLINRKKKEAIKAAIEKNDLSGIKSSKKILTPLAEPPPKEQGISIQGGSGGTTGGITQPSSPVTQPARQKHTITLNAKKNPNPLELTRCAKDGDLRGVIMELASGTHIDSRDELGYTALMQASAYGGHPEIVQLLLDLGADVHVQDYLRWTAYKLAHNPKIQQMLWDAGAGEQAEEKIVELIEAAGRGDLQAIKDELLYGENIDTRQTTYERNKFTDNINQLSMTALLNAVDNRQLEAARLLIDEGADVNARDEYGCSALMFAARNDDLESARLLLGHGADKNAENRGKMDVLMIAAGRSLEVTKLLLENNAYVNHETDYFGKQKNALSFAISANRPDIEAVLRRAGAKTPEEHKRFEAEVEAKEEEDRKKHYREEESIFNKVLDWIDKFMG